MLTTPPPSKCGGQERVGLYLYSPSGPSWPVMGKPLPYLTQIITHLTIKFSSACCHVHLTISNSFHSVQSILNSDMNNCISCRSVQWDNVHAIGVMFCIQLRHRKAVKYVNFIKEKPAFVGKFHDFKNYTAKINFVLEKPTIRFNWTGKK